MQSGHIDTAPVLGLALFYLSTPQVTHRIGNLFTPDASLSPNTGSQSSPSTAMSSDLFSPGISKSPPLGSFHRTKAALSLKDSESARSRSRQSSIFESGIQSPVAICVVIFSSPFEYVSPKPSSGTFQLFFYPQYDESIAESIKRCILFTWKTQLIDTGWSSLLMTSTIRPIFPQLYESLIQLVSVFPLSIIDPTIAWLAEDTSIPGSVWGNIIHSLTNRLGAHRAKYLSVSNRITNNLTKLQGIGEITQSRICHWHLILINPLVEHMFVIIEYSTLASSTSSRSQNPSVLYCPQIYLVLYPRNLHNRPKSDSEMTMVRNHVSWIINSILHMVWQAMLQGDL